MKEDATRRSSFKLQSLQSAILHSCHHFNWKYKLPLFYILFHCHPVRRQQCVSSFLNTWEMNFPIPSVALSRKLKWGQTQVPLSPLSAIWKWLNPRAGLSASTIITVSNFSTRRFWLLLTVYLLFGQKKNISFWCLSARACTGTNRF